MRYRLTARFYFLLGILLVLLIAIPLYLLLENSSSNHKTYSPERFFPANNKISLKKQGPLTIVVSGLDWETIKHSRAHRIKKFSRSGAVYTRYVGPASVRGSEIIRLDLDLKLTSSGKLYDTDPVASWMLGQRKSWALENLDPKLEKIIARHKNREIVIIGDTPPPRVLLHNRGSGVYRLATKIPSPSSVPQEEIKDSWMKREKRRRQNFLYTQISRQTTPTDSLIWNEEIYEQAPPVPLPLVVSGRDSDLETGDLVVLRKGDKPLGWGRVSSSWGDWRVIASEKIWQTPGPLVLHEASRLQTKRSQ